MKLKFVKGPYSEGFSFHCPACDFRHVFYTVCKSGGWKFNGSLQKPTFKPSLKKSYPEDKERNIKAYTCHLDLTLGIIKYHPDCSHSFAGKSVPLPDLKEKSYDHY